MLDTERTVTGRCCRTWGEWQYSTGMENSGVGMQKINILGIEYTDYSLKESLTLVDDYVKSGALNTILYVTTPMLIKAGKSEEEKRFIESMDITLCGDADILRVAKIESVSRLYEVENLVFLKEFLRRIVRGNKKIYLLTESEAEEEIFRRELESFQKMIEIGGSSVISEDMENVEEIINRINDVAPTAVISRLTSGRQEKWMMETRRYINAEVWLGISKDMVLDSTKEPLRKKMTDKIYRTIFRRRINRFEDRNEKK